jgi:hypothetical protein
MNKTIFSTLVATLICVAGTAKAADGISSSTLRQMGLTEFAAMSDHDALKVRGMGFVGLGCCGGTNLVSPSATAIGSSTAAITSLGCLDCNVTSSSTTTNSYNAVGNNYASGSNYSEAGVTFTTANIIDGVGASLTTSSTKIWAGGNSTAKAF